MSTDANPSPGGLKSALKVAVPLIAFGLVIFGVTLFSQYTPNEPDEVTKPGDAAARAEPLVFRGGVRRWDPPSLDPQWQHLPLLAPSRDPQKKETPFEFDLQDRIFQTFYEPGPQVRRAQFWFENRNPHPVTLQLKGVNCGSCSGGRVAAIPAEVIRTHLQRTALAALPVGVFHPLGVGLAAPAGDLAKLDWTARKFSEDPNATYSIPAAPSPPDRWAPQWGILELTFSVNENPKVPLTATFASKVEGTEQSGTHDFAIFYAPSKACEVSRTSIDLGVLDRLTGEREVTFLAYSATRGPGSEFGDLDRPACVVQEAGNADPAKFVEVTKVDRLSEAELVEVARDAAGQGKFTKVRAAYRVTVAVRPKVGDARPDIGKLDRTVFLTAGGTTHSVAVTAMVRGAIWLAGDEPGKPKTEIELPTFKGRAGLVAPPVSLVTETAGTELAVVADECKPRHVEYKLVKKEDRGGQGYYDLNITVPANRQFGALDRDALVVIESKGPNPQRIRIPVKGYGEPR